MRIGDLATVDPMMVREFIPIGPYDYWGGVLVMPEFEVRDVGMADERLDYDADVVDCSNRLFQITTWMMMQNEIPDIGCFPSRRWRNLRVGQYIEVNPSAEHPLLFLGNPIVVVKKPKGLMVLSGPDFLIKSGVELGY